MTGQVLGVGYGMTMVVVSQGLGYVRCLTLSFKEGRLEGGREGEEREGRRGGREGGEREGGREPIHMYMYM